MTGVDAVVAAVALVTSVVLTLYLRTQMTEFSRLSKEGDRLAAEGKWEAACDAYEEALSRLRQSPRNVGHVQQREVLMSLGKAQLECKRFDAAAGTFETLEKGAPNKFAELAVLQLLFTTRKQNAQPDDAARVGERILAVRADGAINSRIRICKDILECYLEINDVEQIKEWSSQLVKLSRQGPKGSLTEALWMRGLALVRLEELDGAKLIADELLEHAKTNGDLEDIARAAFLEGEIALAAKNHKDARAAFARGASMSDAPQNSAMCLEGLARALLAMNDHEGSKRAYTDLLERIERSGAPTLATPYRASGGGPALAMDAKHIREKITSLESRKH